MVYFKIHCNKKYLNKGWKTYIAICIDIVQLFKQISVFSIYAVKPVYKGQTQGITKLAFVYKWPLFRASEATYLS